jgi:hypothetical protein
MFCLLGTNRLIYSLHQGGAYFVENSRFTTQLQLRNATSQRNAIQVTKSKLTKENLRLDLYFHPLFAFSEIVVDPKSRSFHFRCPPILGAFNMAWVGTNSGKLRPLPKAFAHHTECIYLPQNHSCALFR